MKEQDKKILTCYHVTYEFRVNPHSIVCLNVKNLLHEAGAISEVLNDSNGTQTQDHSVRKRTLNNHECSFTN